MQYYHPAIRRMLKKLKGAAVRYLQQRTQWIF